MIPRLSASDLQCLADNGFAIVPEFLEESLVSSLREDALNLHSLDLFQCADIGGVQGQGQGEEGEGVVQAKDSTNVISNENKDEGLDAYRDSIRHSETCFIGQFNNSDSSASPSSVLYPSLPESQARMKLHTILDKLREDLEMPLLSQYGECTSDALELDRQMTELLYIYYPNGGYYKKHVDAEKESESDIRQYSFLLYLNQDWNTEDWGGQLRLYFDDENKEKERVGCSALANYVDVEPHNGTLVLFRSNQIPHEVLDTMKERVAVVGWFLSSQEAFMKKIMMKKNNNDLTTSTTINTSSMKKKKKISSSEIHNALCKLRDQSKSLQYRLKPQDTNNNKNQQTGLLGDFDFDHIWPTTNNNTVKEKEMDDIIDDDSSPDYWKSICQFHILEGHIITLSLNGQRLRTVDTHILKFLLQKVNVLDLGNTDLSCETLSKELLPIPAKTLETLHLAGCGNLGGDEKEGDAFLFWKSICGMKSLKVLDLRYNDLGSHVIQKWASLSSSSFHFPQKLQVLHLEGNQLGDEGLISLLNCFENQEEKQKQNDLRELYLSHNSIGDRSIQVLASFLSSSLFPSLTKISLDKNCIGGNGAKALLEVLPSTKMEKLNVDNNSGIPKELAIQLGKALKGVTTIADGAFFSSF